MTQKDYVRIAAILNTLVTDIKDGYNPTLAADKCVSNFRHMLQEDNARFNKVKFTETVYGGDK